MKILISGATGYIGTHLLKRLATQGYELHAIVRPSTNTSVLRAQGIPFFIFNDDINELSSFISNKKFDGVVHLASLYLSQHTIDQTGPLITSNVLFGTMLLEAATRNQVKWFINTGTYWQHFNNKSYSPVNLYAATKQAFEDIGKYYSETSSTIFTTIKLFDTFGPNDTRPKIFSLWEKHAKSGEPLDMSPGKQIINTVYIENVIDGYEQLIKLLSKDGKKLNGKTFAIGSKQQMTLRKLASLFEKITKTKLPTNWGKRPYRTREVMKPWTKGKSIPGWKPKVSLEKGIKITYDR
jgi:CDP-paratose synthetase